MVDRKEQYDPYHYMTQSEVAMELGVSRPTIGKIEREALKKVRDILEKHYVKEDWL